MADTLITLTQALQLVGLYPCLFIIVFLFFAAGDAARAIVPITYFAVLAVEFFLPLRDLIGVSDNDMSYVFLLFAESLAPALCFLLIIQFMQGKRPPLVFWSVLAIPIIGGSSLVYGVVALDEICFAPKMCVDTVSLKTLYNVFGASLIFLLLVVVRRRTHQTLDPNDPLRSQKAWLILALIILYLQLLVVDLAWLDGWISEETALLVRTLIRLIFIALVLTSLFRVFDKVYVVNYERVPTVAKVGRPPVPDKDRKITLKVQLAMQQEKLYREPDCNREKLARHVGVAEHVLSRIINATLGQSVTELVNSYRLAEAKERLVKETSAITTIAHDVGFNSIASFNRVFKDQTGMSPSAFRKKHS